LNDRAAFRIRKDCRNELSPEVADLQSAEVEMELLLRHAVQIRTDDVKTDGVGCEDGVKCFYG
jgi:hypothetical protein